MDEEKQVVVEESRGLSFKDILFIIRKHWIAIVCFILLGAVGGFTWSKVEQKVRPVYQASGIIMVSPEGSGQSGSTTTQEYQLSNALTNTVVAFIKTNAVLDNVRNDPELKDFKASNLSVSNSTNNLMVTIRYSSSEKDTAVKMVNAVMNWAKTEANRLEEDDQTPVYHMLYKNLNIVDTAQKAGQISHTRRNLLIGLGAGVAVAFLYVVLREMFDNTFKSSEEIERTLNVPVLAGIPDYHFDDEVKGGK